MVNSKLPDGTAPSTAAYNWLNMFGTNGYFFQTWSQLGMTAPAGVTGDTPMAAVFNAFGTSSDSTNLLILDAPTNSVKTAAWQCFTNIIGVSKWAGMTHPSRVEAINRISQSLVDYMNGADAQGALKHTYDNFITVLSAMDGAARTAGSVMTPIAGGTFDAAYKEYSQVFMTAVEDNMQSFLLRQLPGEISWWQGTTQYGKAVAKAVVASLQATQNAVPTAVVISQAFIT